MTEEKILSESEAGCKNALLVVIVGWNIAAEANGPSLV